jgi:hypothetical protein
MSDARIEQAARAVLEKHWDGILPVDPFKIAKRMGVEVRLHDFDDSTVSQTGLLDGKPIVLLSRKTHEARGTRATFAVAHSLGHIELHKDALEDLDKILQLRTTTASAPRPH